MTEPGVPASDTATDAAPDPDGAGPDRPRVAADPLGRAADGPARPKLPRPDIDADGPVVPPATAESPAVAEGAAKAVDAVALALQTQMATSAASTAPPAAAEPAADETIGAVAVPRIGPPTSATSPTRPAPPAPPAVAAATAPGGGPRRRRSDDSAFWRFGFPLAILALTLAIPVLVWAGRKTVLQSTDGKVLTEVSDPTAAGWTALTEPTPTMLLVQTDAAGKPNGLTVMALTGDGAGGMIFLPMTTILDLPDIGKLPLSAVYEKAGVEGLQKAVEGVLGAGMGEVRVVSPQDWADLVAPVGSVSFVNPDDVTVADANGQRTVLFPKGPITLEPKDVATYLGTTSPGENDLNRLERQKPFWDAWLRKVGASNDPNVVPGEVDSGLGRFVRALAASRVEMSPLPVQSAGIPGSTSLVYVPVKDQVSSLVARLVPFPIGAPPGSRPRVRLLDGTGKLDHGLKAAPLIVEGGGQVDQIGNAPAFNQPTTTFTYYDEAQRPAVEKLRAAVGVGDIVKGATAGSAVDVTVVLGADYLAQPERGLTPVSTMPLGTATTTIVGVNGG